VIQQLVFINTYSIVPSNPDMVGQLEHGSTKLSHELQAIDKLSGTKSVANIT
jgi:hypothetical protein